MLTSDEKFSLSDPDGPLGGVLLFDSLFKNDPDLATAFIQFCEQHRPAIFVDWIRRPVRTIAELERETSDFGETIDAFLEWLPRSHGERAVRAIKVALNTEHYETVRRPHGPSEPHRARLRAVQEWIDRLGRDPNANVVSKGDMEALFTVLKGFEDPPVDRQQFEALVSKLNDFLGREQVSTKDFQPVLNYLRFNFPHHEPLLKDFRRWMEDPNRSQAEVCEVVQTVWLERLMVMEAADREIAARALEHVLTAQEFAEAGEAIAKVLRR